MKKLFYLMLLIFSNGIMISNAKYTAVELLIQNGTLNDNQYIRLANHKYSLSGNYYPSIIYKVLQQGTSPNRYFYDLDVGKYGHVATIEIMQEGNVLKLWNDYSISTKIGFLLSEDQTICKKYPGGSRMAQREQMASH
jgi:hypothetical protein